MKLNRLSAAVAAVYLFAASSAWSGPVLPVRPELSTQFAPIEQVGYYHHHHHWRRHHHHYYGEDAYPVGTYAYSAEDAALLGLFWPLWGNTCLYGGCGWSVVYDPGCYFYGCGYGWSLGPFAWGLFGLGFYDPYGIYGLTYTFPSYGGFGFANFGGANFGAFGAGAATGFGARQFGHNFAGRGGFRHFGHFGHGFRHWGYHPYGFHHFSGYRMHGWRHYGGFHHGFHRFGGFHGFGSRHVMAFHGGGFHGGGFHGFHGGGFHGGGFRGGGFHGGGFHGGHR